MSSSYVAYLEAIGADSLVCAVSGLRYVSNENVRRRASGADEGVLPVYELGYEAMLDYEMLAELKPDVVLAYTMGDCGGKPAYVSKIESLGLPVYVLNDYLAEHPLDRAASVLELGRLTGRESVANEYWEGLCVRYNALADSVSRMGGGRVKVLMNLPYSDAWFVPGTDSYMARLVHDAGGEILGAEPGVKSRVITLEDAYRLSQEADVWLNPGVCRSRSELAGMHQLFPKFGPLADGLPVYNNTLRTNASGGNDFWESGAAHPDKILEDLIRIFDEVRSGRPVPGKLNFYFSLE
ncbi:MAG: ABC transporter substrate-binding protein [Candidatus Cryptobacteroides sp.]